MNILITGVSSGIGWGLANKYLADGHQVFGLSRRESAIVSERWRFSKIDLAATDEIANRLGQLLSEVRQLDLVVLNAGRLGEIGDLRDADLSDLRQTMTINVWSNKFVLNAISELGIRVSQVVAISSGASVLGNRGWSGYSISKAALNMLVKLYARECPSTHFCALSPGLVDTEIQETLCTLPPDNRFPGLDTMRAKRGTVEMPDANEAAVKLSRVMACLPELTESGEYVDIRLPPYAEL